MAEDYEQNNESIRNKGLDVSFLKKASDSHLLVAALVATVSFAAGFTLKGGYNDSDGATILSKKSQLFKHLLCQIPWPWCSQWLQYCVIFIMRCLTNSCKVTALLIKVDVLAHKVGRGSNGGSILDRLVHLSHHSGITTFILIICTYCISFILCTNKSQNEKNIAQAGSYWKVNLIFGKFLKIRIYFLFLKN